MTPFRCAILTPYRLLFSASVESVTFATADGEMEILAGHEPVVVPVRIGEVRLRGAEGRRVAAVSEGFASVRPDRVELFVDAAEWPAEIDRERAARSLERAEERLKEVTLPWELERARSSAERARARLRAAGRLAEEGAGRP